MTVRYQTTASGEEIAVMPRVEYDAMKEALDHASAMADYRAGRIPCLTSDEMREMLDASSALSFWRRYRGKTQAELAAEIGIAQNYLSDIENGKREGGIGLWLKLSESLALPVEAIFEADE